MDAKREFLLLCVTATVLAGCNDDGSGESAGSTVVVIPVVSATDGSLATRRAITPQVMLERQSLAADPRHPRPFEPGYFTGLNSPSLRAEALGVAFLADDAPMRFLTPWDANVNRAVLVENRGTSPARVDFKVTTAMSPDPGDPFVSFPQVNRFLLTPGERTVIQSGFPPNPSITGRVGADASFHVTATVSIVGADASSSRDVSFTLANVLDSDPVRTGPGVPGAPMPDADATVVVTVVDANTGRPLQGVQVWASNGAYAVDGPGDGTDASGRTRFSVKAYRDARGLDAGYAFVANPGQTGLLDVQRGAIAGYGQGRAIVTPKAGQTIELTLQVPPQAPQRVYSVDKVLDLGIQAVQFDATADGSLFATVPFHSGFPDAMREQYAYLNVFNYRGDLLWRTPLHDESPTVDVSRDGSLVATTRKANVEDNWASAVVFDRLGNLVDEFQPYDGPNAPLRVVEVQISDDNRLLMAGDVEGGIYLRDLRSRQTLWKQNPSLNQVRKIRFDRQDSVAYVSSGDGYLRCYDMQGHLAWQTFVDAWVYDIEVTAHYVAVSSKAGPSYLHVIDKFTGRTMMSLPVPRGGNNIAVSPDESMLWYGSVSNGGLSGLANTVYWIDGTPRYLLGMHGEEAIFSADSQLVLVKDGRSVALFDREGQSLWRGDVAPHGTGDSISRLIWMSADGKYIVVGMNDDPSSRFWGQAYFLSRK